LDVIAIEPQPWRDAQTDFPPNYMQGELRYRVRHESFLRRQQSTFTFRNKIDQTALPIRSWVPSCRRTVSGAVACIGMLQIRFLRA
jgi:gluconate 2-dehydrogenase alpha chain